MANTIAKGMAQTVLGPIAPEDLGMTDPHEHLLLDFSFAFKPPPEATAYHRAFEPVTEKNLAWVVYDPFRSLDNLVTLDEEVSISEASLFYRAGGQTMIDTTSIGIKRDPLALARISHATGINIIMGSALDIPFKDGFFEQAEIVDDDA